MSGTKQYLRKASLIIGDDDEAIDVSKLRFRFTVKRGDIQTPNTADIRVYNLAPDTSQKIQKEFTRVVLQAGYDGSFGAIFDGTVMQVRRGRETPTDTYLDITAADGDRAYNFSVSAFSLAAGQNSPKNVTEMILRDMAQHGVGKGYIPNDLPGNPLPRGKVVYGMSRDAMRQVAENTDTAWSIQDGKVDMIPLTSYKPSAEIPILTAATGMVGLPEQTQNGIRIRTLLNPNLKIGQVVQIDNRSIQKYRLPLNVTAQKDVDYLAQANKLNDDGYYYIMVADHSGDTRGNNWYTDLICLAIDATMLPPGLVNKFPPEQKYVDDVKGRFSKIENPPDVIKRNP